ncbi:hypothetical protein [Bacillus thermotolerans]|uniref:Abortive phage infection protein n=1 Tax=Bacillus thermotolerans TaxID=1221996 RepID=A0A0F5I1N1_BACTR|nr:hypothetical protein [Bacillus thermotolerans]KKB39170.1 hypothetical protein QY97_00072 [Bacillus thermotolerans]KKB42562.1 hypothetical protein QY96_01428 [Bacillus thermotolerans]KKB42647.1 hypothetical protein QY95_04064 [Bacillus thermotolerans]
MNVNEVEQLLEKLKNREIKECHVSKEHFMLFQQVITKRKDFKHFKGIAQRGGSVLYQYMEEPRS